MRWRRLLPILAVVDLVLAVMLINHRLVGRAAIENLAEGSRAPAVGVSADGAEVPLGPQAPRSAVDSRDVVRINATSPDHLCQGGSDNCVPSSSNVGVRPPSTTTFEPGEELSAVIDMAALQHDPADDDAAILASLMPGVDGAQSATCDDGVTEGACDPRGREAVVGTLDSRGTAPAVAERTGVSSASDVTWASLPVPSSPPVGDQVLPTSLPPTSEGSLGGGSSLDLHGPTNPGQADGEQVGPGNRSAPGPVAPAPDVPPGNGPPAGNQTDPGQKGPQGDQSPGGFVPPTSPVHPEDGGPFSFLDGDPDGRGYQLPAPSQTPELGSLMLFGSGAAGLAGYVAARLRAGRPRQK